MKKLLTSLLFLSISLFVTGCAQLPENTIVDKNKEIKSKNITSLFVKEKYDLKNELKYDNLERKEKSVLVSIETLKNSLKSAAEETLRNNKSHFIIIEENMNQLSGELPENTFKNIKEYCFNDSYSNKKLDKDKKCLSISHNFPMKSYFEFIMIDNPSYEVLAIDAKEIIKEINSYKITIEELNQMTKE